MKLCAESCERRPLADLTRKIVAALPQPNHQILVSCYDNVTGVKINTCPLCSKFSILLAGDSIPCCEVDSFSGRIVCNNGCCIANAHPHLPPEVWAPAVTPLTAGAIVGASIVNAVATDIRPGLVGLGEKFEVTFTLPGLPPVKFWRNATNRSLAKVFGGFGLNPPEVPNTKQDCVDLSVLRSKSCGLRLACFTGWKRRADVIEILTPADLCRVGEMLEHERVYGKGEWIRTLA